MSCAIHFYALLWSWNRPELQFKKSWRREMIRFLISSICWIKPLKKEMKLMKNVISFFFRNSSSTIIIVLLSLEFPPLTTTPRKDSTPKMLSLPPIATRVSFRFRLPFPHHRKSPIGSPISHCRKRVSCCRPSWKLVRFSRLCFSRVRFLSGDIRRRRLNLSTCRRRLQSQFLRRRYHFILRQLIVGLLTKRGLCLYVKNRILHQLPNSRGLFSTDFQPNQLN